MTEIQCENVGYAREAAAALGLHFELLDEHSGYLCSITNACRRLHIGGGTMSAWPLNLATATALAKDKYFCALVLARAGLRVPRGTTVFLSPRYAAMRSPGRELADAASLAAAFGWPVIAKPVAGARGAFVRSCAGPAELRQHLEAMGDRHDVGLIQETVRGSEWRVVTFDGGARWAYRKQRPALIGDGHTTIRALLAALNARLVARGLDPVAAASSWIGGELHRLALGLDDVLGAGQSLDPGPRGNSAAGGVPEALTDEPPAWLAAPALRATEAVGLRLAGVDLMQPDEGGEPIILEVNGSPSVSAAEKLGRRDLPLALWRDVLAAAFADGIAP